MPDTKSPTIQVIDGVQAVDGIVTDCLCDFIDDQIVISNNGDPGRLARTAFEAGRQYERMYPTLNAGELSIDDPLNLPPGQDA